MTGEGPGTRAFVPLLALLLVLAANAGLSGWWMHKNGFFARPLIHEHTLLRVDAILMELALEKGIVEGARAALFYRHHHGPVIPLSGALAGLLTGDRGIGPTSTWLASCVVFGSLLLYGTYRLARSVELSRGLSVAATALAAAAPVAACHERTFLQQGPMAAFVTLAIAAIVRSDGFTKAGPAAAAGFFAGLATLSKNMAPLYLAGPAVAALAVAGRPAPLARRVRGVLIALVAAALPVAPWLVESGALSFRYAGVGTTGGLPDTGRWSYLPLELVNNGWGLLPGAALVLLVTAALVVRPSGPRNPLLIPAAQIVASYPALVWWRSTGNSQYLLSWIPVLGIVAVELWRRARTRAPAVAGAAAVLLVLGAAVNVFLAQRGVDDDRAGPTWLGLQFPPVVDHYLAGRMAPYAVVASPQPERWPVSEFADLVLSRTPGEPRVLTNHQFLSADHMRAEALLKGREVMRCGVLGLEAGPLAKSIADSDYFVHDDLPAVFPPLDHVRAWLAARGIATEVVARCPLVGDRQVSLLAVVHRHGVESR